MNTNKLAEIHEKLGNDYLDTMRARGIEDPPLVAWSTFPARVTGLTTATVFLDEDEFFDVAGCPRDMLATVVANRVLLRFACRN